MQINGDGSRLIKNTIIICKIIPNNIDIRKNGLPILISAVFL